MNLLREISLRLQASGYDAGEAHAVALVVLEDAFGITQTDVYADKVRDFSSEENVLLSNIIKRLEDGEPVQYCLGRARFDGLLFEVTPATLIPRPETEQLVDLVAADVPLSILDIGTGSGCIAVALKRRLPQSRVEAWDISSEAIDVARRNSERHAPGIFFQKKDVLECSQLPKIDRLAVVSNPPYVLENEREEMERRVVSYEPNGALFVPDDNPLLFYKKISTLAAEACAQVYFETNCAFASDVAELLYGFGYKDVDVYRDMFDKERFVVARG